jgi:uncharacterized protein YecT (DUF1311 family)
MRLAAAVICILLEPAASYGAVTDGELNTSEYAACMEKSGGVTSTMLDCASAEWKRQDARLNALYKKLMEAATEGQKSSLKKSEQDWLRYRKSTCELMYTFGGGGTADLLADSSCDLEILTRRVKLLDSLIEQ